jgi:hypothetical protein
MKNNITPKTKAKPTINSDNNILHILNQQMFEFGVISEEIYLKAKIKIDKS